MGQQICTQCQRQEEIDIEAMPRPHADGDTEQRDALDTEIADAKHDDFDEIGGDEGFKIMTRQVCITKRDFIKFGYSERCPLCLDMQAGVPRPTTHHTDECRLRIYLNLYDSNDAKWKSIERRFPDLRKRQGMEEENVNVEGVRAGDVGNSKAPDTPMADDRHFQPGPELSSDMQFENSSGIVPEDDDGFDAGLADDTLMDGGSPYNLEEDIIDPTFPDIMGFDDEAMPESDAMMSALIAAGTSPEAASNFVHRVIGEKNATTFMEMYGQGSLVAEANKQRCSLNVEGLRAFDRRTHKPDGSPWNFNVRADRKLTREMIHAEEPE